MRTSHNFSEKCSHADALTPPSGGKIPVLIVVSRTFVVYTNNRARSDWIGLENSLHHEKQADGFDTALYVENLQVRII